MAAEEKTYNKLVRDRIPDIIRSSGNIPVTRLLDEKEYIRYLEEKLDEEVAEYHRDRNIEELADILEVVRALSKVLGSSFEDVERTRQVKYAERGGFSERIFLISTISENE